MTGWNPAVQWKWGDKTLLSSENEAPSQHTWGKKGQSFRHQMCSGAKIEFKRKRQCLEWWRTSACKLSLHHCLSKQCSQSKRDEFEWGTTVPKASKRSLNREQQCSQTKRDEFEQGTTVFPKWALGVWMGNNSVPKASTRSLNGEQQCSQSEQEEFEQGTAVFPKWVRGVWTGTTVLQSERKEFEQGTAVFPKQTQGVWTGNNSVPKASVRSLEDGEQCERCL